MSVRIRPAAPADAGLIQSFICELAEYEKLDHEVVGDEGLLGDALLCDRPRVFCVTAEWGGARFEWSVLDWNPPSIEFYGALGAVALDDWTMFRVSRNALDALAGAET